MPSGVTAVRAHVRSADARRTVPMACDRVVPSPPLPAENTPLAHQDRERARGLLPANPVRCAMLPAIPGRAKVAPRVRLLEAAVWKPASRAGLQWLLQA